VLWGFGHFPSQSVMHCAEFGHATAATAFFEQSEALWVQIKQRDCSTLTSLMNGTAVAWCRNQENPTRSSPQIFMSNPFNQLITSLDSRMECVDHLALGTSRASGPYFVR